MAVLKSSKNTKKIYRIINLKSKNILSSSKTIQKTRLTTKNFFLKKRNSIWISKSHKSNSRLFKSKLINFLI